MEEKAEFKIPFLKKMELKKISSIPKNKKGLGIGDIYPIVLTIAIVAILLAVVLFILQEFGGQMANIDRSVINETLTTVTEAGQTVGSVTECRWGDFVITEVFNATSSTTIDTGNYSYNSAGLVWYSGINNSAGAGFNNSNWDVTYTYTAGGDACEATEDIVEDFIDFIPWIGIILLIVAAAIVIGIVIRSFAGGSGSRV